MITILSISLISVSPGVILVYTGWQGDAAQTAAQDQDAALAAMNEWVAQYLKIAKVALRGKKQLLEKIGVLARTSKTAAQKAGVKKAAETRAAKKG